MNVIKKIAIILFIITAVSGGSWFIISIPNIISAHNVTKNSVSNKFDYETYEGWALAFYALKRENNVLYSNVPTENSDPTGFKEATILDYPAKYLPNLIRDFGIAVQKPYSGEYVFNSQKDSLEGFYNNESKVVTDGINSFIPLNKDDINANDANVIKALNLYSTLIDKLASANSLMTLEESQNTSIGKFIEKYVEDDTFSEPLAYGQVATQYLEKNLNKYKGDYEAFINEADNSDKINKETSTEVKKIMGIGKENEK